MTAINVIPVLGPEGQRHPVDRPVRPGDDDVSTVQS
jgi:hypothetical protein